MTLQSSAPFDVLGQLTALRRYARSLTRSDVDAEDLVHDALVCAYEKRASFQSGRNLRAWLLSILHNVFIDGRRARQAETQRIAQAAELQEPFLAPVQDHPQATSGRISRVRYGSISRGRRRALFWSYFFLIGFVIFFLTPPVYMFI